MWDLIAVQPMINVLIVLSSYLFNSLGLSIIVLTVIVNFLMLPLTQKQLHASKAMQELQPKLTELQKKYAKDKQGLAKEQMRMYKESGISPAGCVVPMLIQMPIWIALFQSIMRLVAVIPENFLGLSQFLYSWAVVYDTLPLSNMLWRLDLSIGNPVLALLVGGTMWLQQKMVMPATTDPKQQSQQRMMLWMMPMMFAFLTLSFPSGLALFWVTSNTMRVIIQYRATGWGGLIPAGAKQVARDGRYKRRIAREEGADSGRVDIGGADIVEPDSAPEEGLEGEGQTSQESSPTSIGEFQRRTRIDRSRHPKRRRG